MKKLKEIGRSSAKMQSFENVKRASEILKELLGSWENISEVEANSEKFVEFRKVRERGDFKGFRLSSSIFKEVQRN